jgi:hypothetical protein
MWLRASSLSSEPFLFIAQIGKKHYSTSGGEEGLQIPNRAYGQGTDIQPVYRISNVAQNKLPQAIGPHVFCLYNLVQHRHIAAYKDYARSKASHHLN